MLQITLLLGKMGEGLLVYWGSTRTNEIIEGSMTHLKQVVDRLPTRTSLVFTSNSTSSSILNTMPPLLHGRILLMR
jgi:hypothetical protein